MTAGDGIVAVSQRNGGVLTERAVAADAAAAGLHGGIGQQISSTTHNTTADVSNRTEKAGDELPYRKDTPRQSLTVRSRRAKVGVGIHTGNVWWLGESRQAEGHEMKDYYAIPSSRVCGTCFRQTELLHYVELATAYSRAHSARWACPMG